MNIIKRSGKEVVFDETKIQNAVEKANLTVKEIERLSADQIREIVGRGGFIGMNAMNFLVHERDDCETIAALVDHIDHIVGLGGGDCVGFGFDFNDQILKYIPEDELRLVPRVCRDVVHGHGEVPLVLDELRRRGYREEQVEKIGGGNFLRVLRENLS